MSLQPADAAGAETLEIMQAAVNYNRWQYDRIARYLGRRVCEIGSGIGNISELILSVPRDLVMLTDTDPWYRERLRQRFAGRPEVRVGSATLPESPIEEFRDLRLDTVVALNVLEHIEEDEASFRWLASILEPGGRCVVLVPAVQALYGTLDRELAHVRRYTRHLLASRLTGAGLRVERLFYFNFVGMFGWWFNARVIRRSRIPAGQLALFDRLVPMLRIEDRVRLPIGQSLIAVGVRDRPATTSGATA